MVDTIETYKELLQQGARVYDELIHLYEPSKQAENDWAAIAVSETRTQRNGLLERSASPEEVSTLYTNALILSIGHYLDSHWADFTTYPVAGPDGKEYPATDPAKRQRLLQLHAELEGIVEGVARINIALR